MFKAYFLWLMKLITIIIIILFLPVLLVGVITGVSQQLATNKVLPRANKVAVVEVKDMIQDSKKVLKELYKYAGDRSIDGIVLRVDSPGGAVGPSQEIYSAVKNLKKVKPIVASMGSVAASGGLYVALGASKVLAQPGTLTGSIGVIMQAPNFTQIADKLGLQMITIKSGKFKDAGNVFREMTDEDREFLQSTVDVLYRDFRAAVVSSRGIPLEKVNKFADGRVIVGSQALDYGLVDGMGDLYDAARMVFEVKGKPLPKGIQPQLVFSDDNLEKFRTLFENVLSWSQTVTSGSYARGMQAYYLMP